MSTHTALRWEYHPAVFAHSVDHNICEGQRRVAECFGHDAAEHANLVVRAVNAHEELVAALRALVRDCQWTRAGLGFEVESRSGRDIGVAHMLAEARAALAKVEGTP